MALRIGCFLLCLSLFLVPLPATAEQPWIEVRSPHFRVLTNGDKSDARHVVHEFEQMRYVFVTEFPAFRVESGAPLTIFAARDERTAKELEPALWKRKGEKPAGDFHHGWEKQYVMLRLDNTGINRNAVVYHEYTHTILHMNSHWLPLWLDEGMAEFYGYTRFEQNKIYIGSPTERASALSKPPIPIETLLKVNGGSSYYRDEDKVQVFYAESWALVHYMIFAPGMDRGVKLNRFFAMIQQGTDQTQAFHDVFGDFGPMDTALGQYMRSLAFHAAVLQDPPQINEKDFSVTTLSMAQTEAELGGFHLWTHDFLGAKPLVEKALQDDPKLGLAHEEEGFILFAEGQDGVARDEFSQAYGLDGTLYLSLFAKTMLSPISSSNTPADEAEFHDALLKVADLNPRFAPAFIQLARLSVRQNNLPLAFGESRRAEELEPSRAGYHLLTGQILLRMGKDAEAAKFAEYVAKHWPPPDHNEAVELWNRVPAAARPAGVSLTEEFPANTRTAEGIVKSSTCDAGAKQQWTLVLEENGKEQTFHRKSSLGAGFSDTLWWGEDHFNICRHLVGLRAVVEYLPSADGSFTGNFVGMGIRDDLPAINPQNAGAQQASKK